MVESKIKSLIKRILPTELHEEQFYKSFDKRTLKKYKDKYKGKRCFFVGNGPSLNNCNLLHLENEYTFGVNSIFLKNDFIPSFYAVEDAHVIADNLERINSYKPRIMKFFPRNYKNLIKRNSNTCFYNMNIGHGLDYGPNYCIPRFSGDASKRIYSGQSVALSCLQLAFHMGFERVYLVGVDFNYDIPKNSISESDGVILSQDDDLNHFSKECLGPGKRWFEPHLDRQERMYNLSKMVFEAYGRKIFNATVGGKLEVFERVNYNSLFDNE
jgi:hypothetical protein